MSKIRTLIVDDEPPARAKVRHLLATENDIDVVGEAGNGDDAIRLIGELKPDLLFLDIQMPATDGISVLRAVKDEWLPCTIFTTAYAEHAVEAFALHALDYLLKPYSRERFADALARARKVLASAALSEQGDPRVSAALNEAPVKSNPLERFLVKTNDRYLVVRTSEVTWIEAASNYVILHTASGNHVLRRSLAVLEGELDPKQFFRSSRSAIVNLDFVREVQPMAAGEHVIVLRDGKSVPLTRGLREFQERLQSGS